MSCYRGKTAIVTGAGSGIGKALVEELLRRGANVSFCDSNNVRVESLTAELARSDGSVRGIEMDVRNSQDFGDFVADTANKWGRIDFLFNNAGIAVGGEARDYSPEDWRDVIDVNLNGVVNGIRAAYPFMISQGSGHIVNVASIEGLVPFPNTVSYTASKFGVVGLSLALSIEAAGMGVRVSVVCPGYIKTRIFEDSKMIKLDREKVIDSLGKLSGLTPGECAKEILAGVTRNKRIIVVTRGARFLWLLYRTCPGLTVFLMSRGMERARGEIRVE